MKFKIYRTRPHLAISYMDDKEGNHLKSLHFILAQSGNSIIATACPLKSS